MQILEVDGQPAFVVLPYDEYQDLIAKLPDNANQELQLGSAEAEDDADQTVLTPVNAKPKKKVPSEVAKAISNGDSPIKAWREYRGVSQDRMARKLGVSPAFVDRIEKSQRNVPGDLLSKLAKSLDISVADLEP